MKTLILSAICWCLFAAPASVTATTTAAPLTAPTGFNCNFDADFCGWTQSQSDQLEWTRTSGTTSSQTGPETDNSGTGSYIFVDASVGQEREKAVLESPELNWNIDVFCVTMYYSMVGTNVGPFTVELVSNFRSSGTVRMDTIHSWTKVKLPFSPRNPFQIRLVAEKGPGPAGYIAVDDISITPQPCLAEPTAETTTAALTTAALTTAALTTAATATSAPATAVPTTAVPTTAVPTTTVPAITAPATTAPATAAPTTAAANTAAPTNPATTTAAPATAAPTTAAPTTAAPVTNQPAGQTTQAPGAGATTASPGQPTQGQNTPAPATAAPTTSRPPPTTPAPRPPVVTTPTPATPAPQITVIASQERNNRFSCLRPTTPCNTRQGFCQATSGYCACFNGAYGLQCQVPGIIPQNGGACRTKNPCVTGTCYDLGRGATCLCPDGFYGNICQNRMISAQCHPNGMVINVLPYGDTQRQWNNIRPPTVSNCRMPTANTFTTRWPQFMSFGWSGFVGAFYNKNDPCAGSAVIEETATSTRYSRDLYIPYSSDWRHFTDTYVRITCIIPKPAPSVAPPTSQASLPPPRVTYNMIDQAGQPLQPTVGRGTTIGLVFRLQPIPNNASVTDMKVEICIITNGRFNIPVLVNGCPRGPIGRRLLKPTQAISVLWMTTADFPPGSLNWNFQCRVRTCTATDRSCSTAPACDNRRKRSAVNLGRSDANTVLVSAQFHFAN